MDNAVFKLKISFKDILNLKTDLMGKGNNSKIIKHDPGIFFIYTHNHTQGKYEILEAEKP